MKKMPPAELESSLGGPEPHEPTVPTLESRATIEFPQALDSEGLKDLFRYIGGQKGYAVFYRADTQNSFDSEEGNYSAIRNVTGNIRRQTKHFTGFSKVTFSPQLGIEGLSNDSHTLITGLSTNYSGSREMVFHQEALWGSVKRFVGQYFSQRSTAQTSVVVPAIVTLTTVRPSPSFADEIDPIDHFHLQQE